MFFAWGEEEKKKRAGPEGREEESKTGSFVGRERGGRGIPEGSHAPWPLQRRRTVLRCVNQISSTTARVRPKVKRTPSSTRLAPPPAHVSTRFLCSLIAEEGARGEYVADAFAASSRRDFNAHGYIYRRCMGGSAFEEEETAAAARTSGWRERVRLPLPRATAGFFLSSLGYWLLKKVVSRLSSDCCKKCRVRQENVYMCVVDTRVMTRGAAK